MPIKFHVSYDKIIEAILWIANERPGVDIYRVVKVMFFADKIHINKHGRPITGDTYIKMPYGPVPSAVYDLIRMNDFLSPVQRKKMDESFNIASQKEQYKLTAKRKPDFDYFSKSDLVCLRESLEKYGNLSFDDLYSITHDETCYIEARDKGEMDYCLFIDSDNENKDEIIRSMSENSEYVHV